MNAFRRSALGVLLSALVAWIALAVVPAAHAAGTGTITGSVTVPDGYDVRAVRIVVTTVDQPAVPWAPVAATMAGTDGSFTLTGVPVGTYNVGFATYWSDLDPCSTNRDRWWTSPGVASGICNYQLNNGVVTGAGAVTVTDGGTTALGSTPLLTNFTKYHYAGKVLVPAGHTTAGLQAELWAYDGGAWYIHGGWYRLTSVPVQTLTSAGTFAFDLIDGPWSHGLAVRFVDPAANGYKFSFATGGLTSATTGQDGVDFATGSVGLLAIPTWGYANAALGTQQVKFALGYTSGGVTVTGTPAWGRTLTAHSNVVWSNPAVGTAYQWYRNGVALDGVTGSTYALDGADDGWEAQISVRAVPDGAWAYTGSPIETAPLTIENTTPYAAAAPKVSGTVQVDRMLTASTGTWRPTSVTYTYAYRWFRGTTVIPGATKRSYTVTAKDKGAKLGVEVTASRPPDCPTCAVWFAGPGVSRSAATAAVKPGTIASSWIAAWPTRTAKAKVGSRAKIHALKLTAAGKAQHLRATYQWYVGGKLVKGATGTSYVVKKSAKKRSVTLKVTLGKTGYTSWSRTVSFGTAR